MNNGEGLENDVSTIILMNQTASSSNNVIYIFRSRSTKIKLKSETFRQFIALFIIFSSNFSIKVNANKTLDMF